MERRDIHFNVGEYLTPTWMKGDLVLTAGCDALSVLLPEGERFFIKSVTAYIGRIKDPVLQEQVRAFVIQEALHTREHDAYNRALAEGGCDVAQMEARAAAALAEARAQISRLAVTVAIEHLTATFAHVVLSNPSLFADAPAPLRDLWTWHSLEEMEHKGVAFDVYLAVTADWPRWKRYGLRCISMLHATRSMMTVQNANEAAILQARGYRLRGFGRLRRLWLMFGSPGLYRRGLPYYLRFFRPGFHPWEKNEDASAGVWRDRFNAMMERPS
jgi:predicted metal-dependent hydrolase